MRKVALVVAAGCLLATSAFAHTPPGEVINAVKFPAGNEPTIDGDCSDWDAVPGDSYWVFADAFIPAGEGDSYRHPVEGLEKGDMDQSSFSPILRGGWSEHTNDFYYCHSVFDDAHTIDRAGDFDWYEDDGVESFFRFRHISPEEATALGTEGFGTYLGFNFSVPQSAAGPLWHVIGLCVGCEWLTEEETELHNLQWSFDGEEFGQSTYHYEHRVHPFDGKQNDLEGAPENFEYQTLEDNQIIHYSIAFFDDDAHREDGRGGQWIIGGATGPENDWLMEPLNPNITWPDAMTAVESESWGRIKAQY
jgi:hypothetical protein